MTQPRAIPDDPVEFMEVFRKLCEEYADAVDGSHDHDKHARFCQRNLLEFCHAYAYKINGIEAWT